MSRLGARVNKALTAFRLPWVADPVTPHAVTAAPRPPSALGGLGQLEPEYLSVEDRVTEVFRLPAASDEPKIQVIVVPGNPGQGAYYSYYMQHLSEQLHGAADIWSITHKGFELNEVNPGEGAEASALQEQITHLVDFAREHLIGPGRPPIAFIGHSIGAYICLKAAERLEGPEANEGPVHPASGIAKIISLYPFYQTDFNVAKQAFLRTVTAFSAYLALVGACLGSLPRLVQGVLLQVFASDLEPHAITPTLGLLTRRTTHAALFMGHTEFRDLSEPFDYRLLTRLGGRASVHCAPEDHWFPDAQWDELRSEAPGTQAFWEENQRHGFCVSQELSHDAAVRTAIVLRQTLADVAADVAADV